MRLNRLTWQYAAAITWLVFTVALASWWLIFGLSQARHLSELEGPAAAHSGNVTRMLVWEGVILVSMLLGGGVALVFGIRREQKRRKGLKAFFMAFTHDLKTSLTSLQLQAEALQEDLPEAADNPYLLRMLKDSVRLQLQLENALFLTQTDGAVFIEALDVRAVVGRLVEDWPELRIEVTGDAAVRADRRALESILRNLLQNSVVHGRATRVSVAVQRAASGTIEITLSDDGVGAKSDMATALDQPFVRRSETSGSGVGLYVCKGLLNQMEGHIRLLGGPSTPLGAGRTAGFAVTVELPEAA